MTMGWMETIHFIGLDLQVATLTAVASLDVAARAIRFTWCRITSYAPPRGSLRVRARGQSVFRRTHPAGHAAASS